MRKIIKVVLIIGFFVFGLIGIFILSGIMVDRQKLVAAGLARPEFPYKKYTQEEINKLYPPQLINENVATTQSPEETHKKFIENLKKGDINAAVECCFREGDWSEQKKFIQGVKDKGMYNLMINDLSVIKEDKSMTFDNSATYLYSGTLKGEKVGNFMHFVKTSDGKWLIKDF